VSEKREKRKEGGDPKMTSTKVFQTKGFNQRETKTGGFINQCAGFSIFSFTYACALVYFAVVRLRRVLFRAPMHDGYRREDRDMEKWLEAT